MSWMHHNLELDLRSAGNQTEVDTNGMFENKEWKVVKAPIWKQYV